MNTAAYLRVSSDKQDVARQRESIERWAERNGPISLWFEDSTGRNPRDKAEKRQGFQRLLKAVHAGIVDCIVVDSQDRFGTRDAYQWGSFLTVLRDNGCRLVDASGRELSGDDDSSVLTGTIGALTSTREQKEKAARNIKGKVSKAKLGEYQGGNPPYGFDVVCFAGEREKWRTLYVGHYKRWKVYLDGERERFDGKDNSPRKDATDTLYVRPTIQKERLKIVRQIFVWYASEAISPRQIATRLNQLKIDPVFGDAWDKVKVSTLLRNPVYIGFPTWNKRAGSRFVEYIGGDFRDVAKTKGKAKASRRRSSKDFVQPDKPQFKPIIDHATWDKVQRKLEAATQAPKRSSQTAELWLRPFLVCGHCGKPMRATTGRSTARLWPSYYCSTYGTYGIENPSGCHCHRVRHDVLERIVLDYMAQTAPKIAKLLTATKTGNLEAVKPLVQAVFDQWNAIRSLDSDMQTFINENMTAREFQRLIKSGKGFSDIYGILYERVRPSIEKRIAAKDSELDTLLTGYVDLTGRVRDRARAKMEELQAEIDSLKANLIDLREPWGNVTSELLARRKAVADAQHALSNGSASREKTEAVSGVIDRIVCQFRHTVTKVKRHNGKSFLDRVEIVPVSGASVCFTDGSKPGPG